MLLLGARVLRALEIAREVEQVAEFARRVVLHRQQRTVAQIEAHDVSPGSDRVRSVHRVARDRARHAVPAAAAATELRAAHRDHFDPGLAQQRVRVGVPVVARRRHRAPARRRCCRRPTARAALPRRCRRSRRRASVFSPSASLTTSKRCLLVGTDLSRLCRRAARCSSGPDRPLRGTTVHRSRSQKVNTVSRCIAARLFGIRQPITRVAPPCLKSSSATWNTAWRVVRSPMPISTTPLPIGMTSPPSTRRGAVIDVVGVAPPDL